MTNPLSGLDPNWVVLVLTGLGGWLYRKAKGDKTDTASDAIAGILRGEAARIASDPDKVRRARVLLDMAAWSGLERVGIKRSKAVEKLVNIAIEHTMADVYEKVIQLQLNSLVVEVEKVPGAFVPK